VRILWVKAGGLLPLDSGGRIRSYNLVRELAKRHQVAYFGFHSAQDNAAQAELEVFCERVVRVPLLLPKARSFAEFWRYAFGIASSEPYNIRKYCQGHVAKELRELVKGESYDVIVCDFQIAAGVIPWDLSIPKLLFTHNVESTIWKRHYQVAKNPLWKLLSWREWRAMERAETQYLQKADFVIAVSNADREVFARIIPPDKLGVIPTGVDIDYFQPSTDIEQENAIVFTGSMDWLPNEDGIFYFIQEILPRISQAMSGVKLIVVGRKPSRRLQALAAENARVQLTGWVDDVRPYLAKGTVCIVPLRVGSGTRLKIFEAMSMAKAVVSTTIGAEGLPVTNGQDVLLEDSPEDFAKSVVMILQDKSLRRRLGLAARNLVESKFGWPSVAAEFEFALRRTIELRCGGRETAMPTARTISHSASTRPVPCETEDIN
jgi:polysaccharide biosynthesis protein PslH